MGVDRTGEAMVGFWSFYNCLFGERMEEGNAMKYGKDDIVVIAVHETDEAMARGIAEYLGVPLVGVRREYFYDGQGPFLPKLEASVRNKFVVIVSSVVYETSARQQELYMILSAACDSKAEEVLVVIPYYTMARSDKKDESGIPYGFRAVVAQLETPGRVTSRRVSFMLCDLHNDATASVFSTVDVLTVQNVLLEYVREVGVDVVISADTGRLKSAVKIAKELGLPYGVVDKTRVAGEVEATGVFGADVAGKKVLVFEDEIGSGDTIERVKSVLLEAGAKGLLVACSHAPFYSGVGRKLWGKDTLGLPLVVVSTNNVPITISKQAMMGNGELMIIDVSAVYGEAVRRFAITGESLGEMHGYDPKSLALRGRFEVTGQKGLYKWCYGERQ